MGGGALECCHGRNTSIRLKDCVCNAIQNARHFGSLEQNENESRSFHRSLQMCIFQDGLEMRGASGHPASPLKKKRKMREHLKSASQIGKYSHVWRDTARREKKKSPPESSLHCPEENRLVCEIVEVAPSTSLRGRGSRNGSAGRGEPDFS